MTTSEVRTRVPLGEISLWTATLCAAGFAGFVFGRLLQAPARDDRPTTKGALVESIAHEEPVPSFFAAEWRSQEEIDGRVASMDDVQVRRLLQDQDGRFWRAHPNAFATFRAALTKLVAREQPLGLLTECAAWIDGWKLPEALSRRLWRAAVAVVCSRTEVDINDLASLVRNRSKEHVLATLEAFLEARPAASVKAALAQVEQYLAAIGLLADEAFGSRAKALVISAWLIRAPDEALELAAAADPTAMREALHEPLRRMRALDPKGAGRLLRMASEYQVYPEAIGETAFIAGFTPEEIREAFKDAPLKARLRYFDAYASRADETAPDVLVTMASLFPVAELVPEASGNGLSQYGTNALLRALAVLDPAACERWLEPLDAKLRQKLLENIRSFPALFDAQFARFYLDRAETREAATVQPNELRRAIRAVANEDPELALSYLDRLPADHRAAAEKEIRRGQVASLARDNPAEAMAMAESAPEPLRKNLIAFALGQQFVDDPEAAMRWLAKVESPEFRKSLEVHLATLDTRMSGEARYSRLLSLGAEESLVRMSVYFAVQSSALSEPERAGALIKRLTNPELQGEATQFLVSQWAEHAPEKAAAWAATLPPGPARDAAADMVVKRIPEQPDIALAWAAAISEPGLRHGVVEVLIRSWANVDHRIAERLADAAPVTDEQRAMLFELIANTPRARREAKGL